MQLNVMEVANGKWRGILATFGLTEKELSGKHCPCPLCGGKDRFRFDDKQGNGTFYCSKCGAGRGIDLVMRVTGNDFKTAATDVEKAAGFVKSEAYRSAVSDEAKIASLKKVWSESKQITETSQVVAYLSGRGLIAPKSLRTMPMAYRDGSDYLGMFETMLAKVSGPDGKGVTIHRTYLKDGKKASVPSPKKLMPGLPLKGAAIRLFPHGECLGIAEGIETAIAASMRFDVPVWSCVSASGIESFIPPAEVKRVIVFADNDESFTGQAAAFAFAKRMANKVKVEIEMPTISGDWADMVGVR